MPTPLRRAFAVTALAALALFASACSNTEPVESSSPPADATRIAVSATEYAYDVSATTIEAGAIVFDLTNDGAMDHDLVLEGGPGGGTEIIAPGETDSLSVTLEPGTYTLYCSVGNHRAQGMEFTVTVE
jgi:plastocyanin